MDLSGPRPPRRIVEASASTQRLAETRLLRVDYYEHPSVPHVDPKEELWTTRRVVFTEGGRWRYRDRFARGDVGRNWIVMGTPGQYYTCGHHEEIPEDRCLNINFTPAAERELESLTGGKTFSLSLTRVTPRFALLRERIKRLAANAADEMELDETGRELLRALLETSRHGQALLPLPPRRRQRESAQAALEFMTKHFSETLRLEEVAAAAGFSPFHFSRVFKEKTGLSPYAYLRTLRLDHASKLLRRTRLSVTDVAQDSGFPNLSQFINAFRDRFGLSPRRFRENPNQADKVLDGREAAEYNA